MSADAPDRDPCDEWLTPTPTPTPADLAPLRERVRQRSMGVLHRRRWRQRLAWAAALVACFAAGAGAMHLLAPSRPPPEQAENRELAPKAQPQAVAPSGRELEWRALEDARQRAEIYRQAADHYLNDEADLAAALRCYGAALDRDAEALKISTDDSWLLLLIKDARLKEKDDASKGS
jgi:hypothetical protein